MRLNTFLLVFIAALSLFSASIITSCGENPWMESILKSDNDKMPIGPSLSGTATISGIYRIGETLTVDTDNISGGSGVFSYQWKAGGVNVGTNSDTYTIQGTDAGKVITCVITRSDIAGSVTAAGEAVPFDLILVTTGLTDPGDSVSFNDSNSVTAGTALGGVKIPIYCELAGTHVNNILRLSLNGTSMITIQLPGSNTYNYTVNPADAVNGEITIAAVSIHTDLTILDPPTNVIFNQNGTISFTPGTNNPAGSEYSYTLCKNGTPVTAFTDQSIAGGGGIVTALIAEMLRDAGTYTVRVMAETINPAYLSPSSAVSSLTGVIVRSVTVSMNGVLGTDRITVGGTDYDTSTFTIYVFNGENVTLIAVPDVNRYVTWSGGSTANEFTISNITANTDITATFAASIPITSAAITVTVPVGGRTPSTAATGVGNFTKSNVSWSPNHSSFASGTVYTASITLTANTNYVFAATGFSATINGNNATVLNNDGTSVVLSCTFTAMPSEGALNTIDEVIARLAEENEPVYLPVSLDLGAMTINATDIWHQLLDAIETADKDVELDLSACTMADGMFNPDSSVSAGKDKIVSLVLPDSATRIPDGTNSDSTFKYFFNLEYVRGDSITDIGVFAFAACHSLNKAEFPAARTIGEFGFTSCTSLEEADFPLVPVINDGVFYNCSALAKINIPSVTSIGTGAFGQTALLTLTEPINITMGSIAPSLGTGIFANVQGSVNVNVPYGASGYSPAGNYFIGPTETVSGTDTGTHWANALRGMGWDPANSTWAGNGYYGTGAVNTGITVNIQVQTP